MSDWSLASPGAETLELLPEATNLGPEQSQLFNKLRVRRIVRFRGGLIFESGGHQRTYRVEPGPVGRAPLAS